MAISKENFFKPGKISAESKAAATDATAKGIIAAESVEREKKTERLKQLRLEQQDAAPAGKAKPGSKSSH